MTKRQCCLHVSAPPLLAVRLLKGHIEQARGPPCSIGAICECDPRHTSSHFEESTASAASRTPSTIIAITVKTAQLQNKRKGKYGEHGHCNAEIDAGFREDMAKPVMAHRSRADKAMDVGADGKPLDGMTHVKETSGTAFWLDSQRELGNSKGRKTLTMA